MPDKAPHTIIFTLEEFIPAFGKLGGSATEFLTLTVIVASPIAFKPLAKAVTLTVFVVVLLRVVVQV
jgi:hypothetical protein